MPFNVFLSGRKIWDVDIPWHAQYGGTSATYPCNYPSLDRAQAPVLGELMHTSAIAPLWTALGAVKCRDEPRFTRLSTAVIAGSTPRGVFGGLKRGTSPPPLRAVEARTPAAEQARRVPVSTKTSPMALRATSGTPLGIRPAWGASRKACLAMSRPATRAQKIGGTRLLPPPHNPGYGE